MNKSIFLMGLILLANNARAEEKKKIYKYTDENGVTHYAETKPDENYEEADLPALSIVPSAPIKNTPPSNNTTNTAVQEQKFKFKLVAPVDEQNIWGTGQKLTAKTTPLSEAQQSIYQIQFVIDGKKYPPSHHSTQDFENIDRGEHKIQALMIKKDTGAEVKKSKTVTFYMHQNTKK
ncbi:MAG: DUF4124 domain-containing protein [Xanthomonadales bacterium]|nr:DUF4124 domain-containing protein [Xanthomonadales bacterium]